MAFRGMASTKMNARGTLYSAIRPRAHARSADASMSPTRETGECSTHADCACDRFDLPAKEGATAAERAGVEEDIERWFTTFPRLAERHEQPAGTLSGGEQQMLAIARALMSRPRLLLCDEISLGLAPRIVQELFETIAQINAEMGTALLLVEQNAALAMKIASSVYLLEVGEVVESGDARDFEQSESIRRVYLGY